MTRLEELKAKWQAKEQHEILGGYDKTQMEKIISYRVKHHTQLAIRYFYINALLQTIVYIFLVYIFITYQSDTVIQVVCAGGVVLYIFFSIFLYIRAKALISGSFDNEAENSMHEYINKKYVALKNFFAFKKLSDVILMPLSSVTGVFLTIELLLPGGVWEHYYISIILFTITIVSCFIAIRKENITHFREPLVHLKKLLEEFQ